MERELKRLAVLQTGKMLGILYGFFSLLMIPIIILFASLSNDGIEAVIPLIVMVFLYPAMGFVGGIILAALYNLAAKWVGGLRFTVE